MKISDVRERAFAMPLTNPSFPRGPYRFVNREYLIITYRTDPEALRAVVPEPLTFTDPIVNTNLFGCRQYRLWRLYRVGPSHPCHV